MNRIFLFCSVLLIVAAAHGCVGTPGRAITGELELALLDVDTATRNGWTVEVEEAALLLSSVMVRDATMPAAVAFVRVLLLPTALAHGGHGEGDSTVLASWVGNEVLVLGETHPPLFLEGRAGTTDRGALVLGGVSGDPRLHGLPIWVQGTASNAESTVRFAGGITLPEAESERLVEGIPMGGAIDDGVTVRVELDLGVFFDAIHFERLVPGADGVSPIDAGSQAAVALRLGMGDLAGYSALVTENEGSL